MSGWFELVESEVAYRGPLSTVRIDRLRLPDGGIATREVVEHDDAVAVVPVFGDGTVVMLRQYRQPFGSYQLEIPAGKLDEPGEGIEAAARRELREEAGLEVADLTHLTTFRNSAGWSDEVTHVYLGTDAREVGLPDDFTPTAEEAAMEVVRLSLDEAVTGIEDGTIVDAKSIVGLLLAARHRTS